MSWGWSPSVGLKSRDGSNTTSFEKISFSGGQIAIVARASGHGKCERCWHHREDVGSHSAHPTLCGRCIENVDGAGEVRRFA